MSHALYYVSKFSSGLVICPAWRYSSCAPNGVRTLVPALLPCQKIRFQNHSLIDGASVG